jgi:homoserine dehydrogenase
MGRTCKLLAYGQMTPDGVAAYVEPTIFTSDRLEASVGTNYNMISYQSNNAGIQSFYGQGAGRFPTAYNVVSDCLDIIAGEDSFYTDKAEPAALACSSVSHAYYVRTSVCDEFLSSITEEKGEGWVITAPVSVEKMHAWAEKQKEVDAGIFFAGIQ